MLAKSETSVSTLLKNKIGKLRINSRSKSSPTLIDSNIQSPVNKLVQVKEKHSIPHCQNVIDLTILKGQELHQSVQLLITTLFSDWVSPTSLRENMTMERVSGAMTNAVFFVTVGTKRMLLRVYGVGCEQILDRNKELDWLSRLSQLHIGPKLLGIFGNGRFEEYLPSTTLTRDHIRQHDISRQIATRLHQLHAIVETFPPHHNEQLEVWINIEKWFHSLADDIVPKLVAKNISSWQEQLDSHLDLVQLREEIDQCKLILSKSTSPIVFAHNDTQYGNILKINGTNQLVVIDFEYAGYNPRAYDIANHFCEWMYDYHSSTPARMQVDQYPTHSQQIAFLSAYSTTEADVLLNEVNEWKMACHLFWALWGFVQASQSEIDFDYFGYSIQRLAAFRSDLGAFC